MADDEDWVVVVPVKSLPSAKSRLAGLSDEVRRRLALAMAIDTITAAAATDGVREVLVVSNDADVARAVGRAAAVVADEPGGLAAAFTCGIAAAIRRHSRIGVALMVGDLPALRPSELRTALDNAVSGSLVVADAAGVGSTMLASRTPAALRPSFGDGSLARHRALGARLLAGPPSLAVAGLRRDVDTAVDLDAAVALGVGPQTAAVVRELEFNCASR